METPWGHLTVRDAHAHLFSHRFFELLTGGRPVDEVAAQLGWDSPPEAPEELADRWVAELDKHGVGSAALIASMPGDEESVARAVARHPDRFHGQFLLNPLAPDAAAARLAEKKAAGLPPQPMKWGLSKPPSQHGSDSRPGPVSRNLESMPARHARDTTALTPLRRILLLGEHVATHARG